MIPEVQECLIPMFCNGEPLWGQFFVRDPATGKVKTKCRYEVDRARARLDIMNAEYKLIAHELSEELKMIPTAVSPTENSFSAALTSTAPHVLSTKDLTTSPTTETTTKVSCAITFNGICYWTHVQDEQNVNFARAEEICSNKASIPAHFPTERVYNDVAEDLRSKIPSGRSVVYVWTGVTIDTNTGNVIHPSGDTYVKWLPRAPYTGSSWKTYTHVVLLVNSDPGSTNQGMFNNPPHGSLRGVVCQDGE